MSVSTCANCNTDNSVNFTSLLENLWPSSNSNDSEITVVEGIGELFGVRVGIRLGSFVDTFNVGYIPQLCQRCLQTLQNSLKYKNGFLSLCHQNGSLGSILLNPGKDDDDNQTTVIQQSDTDISNTTDADFHETRSYESRDLHFDSQKRTEQNSDDQVSANEAEIDDSKLHRVDENQLEISKPHFGQTIKIGSRSKVDLRNPGTVDEVQRPQSQCHLTEAVNDTKLDISARSFPECDNLVTDNQRGTSESSSSSLVNSTSLSTTSRPFQCSQCKTSFAFQANLLAHVATTHVQKAVSSPFQCPNCSYVTMRWNCLWWHMFTHTDERPHRCPIENCRFSSIRKPALNMHMQVYHSTSSVTSTDRKYRIVSTQKFKCLETECDAEYSFEAKLLAHSATKHSLPVGWVPNDGYSCPIPLCTFNTRYAVNVVNHCFTHTKEKVYKCTDCDFSAIKFVSLKLHLATHNKSASDVCEPRLQDTKRKLVEPEAPGLQSKKSICNSPFPIQVKNVVHTAPEHGSEIEHETEDNPRSSPNYTPSTTDCPTMSLFTHKSEGSGPPHQCEVCGYSTKTIFEFRSHCLVFHNVVSTDWEDEVTRNARFGKLKQTTMFPCNHCGQAFELQAELFDHVQADECGETNQ